MPGGLRKAALLLMTLDPPNAAQLLRGLSAELVQELAVEMAYLTQQGVEDTEKKACLREFCGLLAGRQLQSGGEAFVRRLLQEAVGPEQSRKLLEVLPQRIHERDPFLSVRTAEIEAVAAAIAGESPSVAALVMSELSPAQNARLLSLLPEATRAAAVRGMTRVDGVPGETRRRIASLVRQRLEEIQQSGQTPGSEGDQRRRQLRKVAVLLRGLETQLRDVLLTGVGEKDPDVAREIQNLMVIWEDMMHVADRSLQEVLRTVNSKKLALALVGAADGIIQKIRANISERASAMLDEEAQLLSQPKESEIGEGREEILNALRELNQAGELRFIEE